MKANPPSELVNVRIGAIFPTRAAAAWNSYKRLIQLDDLMTDMTSAPDSARPSRDSSKQNDGRTGLARHPYLYNARTENVYDSENQVIGICLSLFDGRRENFHMTAKSLVKTDDDSILSDAALTAERLVSVLHEKMSEINFAAVAVIIVRDDTGLYRTLPPMTISNPSENKTKRTASMPSWNLFH